MKLKKLEIIKFRGLDNKTFEIPQDKTVCAFVGKNGTGKSTSVDAVMWLLCDETFVYGGQNANNLDKNSRETPLEVIGTFIMDNGSELELKRTFKQKFKKDGTFSTYANELYINGATYTVNEYLDRIKSELGIEKDNDPNVTSFNTLRSILDYTYLSSIKYQVAREKIEKLLKLTKDDELANNPSYSIIKQELQSQLYDVSKTKTKLNKNKSLAEGQLKQINAELDLIKKAYKPLDKARYNELLANREKIEKMVYTHSAEYQASISKLQELDSQIKEQSIIYNNSKKEYDKVVEELKTYKNNIEFYKNKIASLKETFVLTKNTATKCPKCNYALNAEEIQNKLDKINAEGTKANDIIKDLQEKAKKIDVDTAKNAFESESKKYLDMVENQKQENQNLKSIIEKEDRESQIFNNDKMEKLRVINGEISALLSASNETVLKEKEKDFEIIKSNIAKVEQQLIVLENFANDKNQIINNRINEVFPNLDFRLFETSDSGAVQNTCKVYLKNVEFEGVNTGNQIMLGFEIVESLRKVLGVKESLPIIFDNLNDLDKNNFNNISKKNNQIITTYIQNVDDINLITL